MNIIDKTLLAPYYVALKLRHFLYNRNIIKSYKSELKTICIGNITVGGTGKTPHTELLLRLLKDARPNLRLAVLSRGYKRKTSGFQQVSADGSVKSFGDEPLQIKRKFPDVTVVVDSSRKRALEYLKDNNKLKESKKVKKCLYPDFSPVDLVILDDAFQHREVRTDVSIVLMDYSNPINKDHLLPIGRLRDLPSRAECADVLIFTKCPHYLDEWEKGKLAQSMGLKNYDVSTGWGINSKGQKQGVYFTAINYIKPIGIFDDADARYIYSKRLILFTGIANASPLVNYLCDSYDIVENLEFPDHHNYSFYNIKKILSCAKQFPTAVIVTTEKDAQRIKDFKSKIPLEFQKRMFQVPIEVDFINPETERESFVNWCSSI